LLLAGCFISTMVLAAAPLPGTGTECPLLFFI
jgi:hypothetical protein